MPSDIKRLRPLEEENPRLKKAVTDLALDKDMLQDVARNTLGDLRNGERSSITGGGNLPSVRGESVRTFRRAGRLIRIGLVVIRRPSCGNRFGRWLSRARAMGTGASLCGCAVRAGA